MTPLFPALGPWTRAALLSGFAEPGNGHTPRPAGDLDDELDLVCEQKLSLLLLRHLDAHGLHVTAAQRLRLESDATTRIVRSLRMRRVGSDTTELLAAAGIHAVTTKGAALAEHYRDPWTRTSTDVDLVVAPARFAAAFRTLTAAGWSEIGTGRLPWPGFNRRCRESVNLVADRSTSVDLHHRPSPWLWSTRLDGTALTATGSPSATGVPAVRAADNLAVAALQLIGDHRAPGSKLIAWRDLAELGRALDPADTAARLVETGTAGVVGALLGQLPEAMRPAELAERLAGAPVAHRRRLEAMIAAARGGHALVAHVLRLPAPRAALFVAGTIVPSRAFLASRFPGVDARRRRRHWLRSLWESGGDAAAVDDVPVAGDGAVVPAPLRARDDVVRWGPTGDGAVVVDHTRTGVRTVLRDAWASAWPSLVEGTSAADLVAARSAVRGEDPTRARADVTRLIATLVARDLLAA